MDAGKKEYTSRLSAVAMTYQTYSLHDASHSETILMQIAYFLGEERVRQLSPTDAWLILESAYCHDLGMVVTARNLYNEFSKMSEESFESFSNAMYQSDSYDISSAWSYLEPLFQYGRRKQVNGTDEWLAEQEENTEKLRNLNNLKDIFESDWFEWPLHFTQSFRLIIQEYCRPKHAEMSRMIIEAESEEKSYDGLIPPRLRHLVANIAALHGDKRKKVIKSLPRKTLGFGGDYAHPRFVAELIRIGDLLDMDNNRFNKYQLAVSGNDNYSSFAHQLKHKALRNFLITPEKICVTANFTSADAKCIRQSSGLHKCDPGVNDEEWDIRLCLRAYKEMSGWLKMLRQELDFFCKNWYKIVPEGLSGNCPYFKKEIMQINGESIDTDLVNLRYYITAKRASEIIEGSGLYDDVFVAFIREILQNSMDATKREIYNTISAGRRDNFKTPLEFYRFISRDIRQMLIQIDFTEQEGKKCIRYKIRDHGIGISSERLKKMQYIGDIRDYKTATQEKAMPPWWKPTGSFGIGMQTIFYFAKDFSLITRTRKEKVLRKMRFYSTRTGGRIDACSIGDEKKAEEFGYGTEIEIDIPVRTMELFQQRQEFGKGGDYFGETAEVYREHIDMTVKEVCGSFGIPVVMNFCPKNKEEIEERLSVNRYLSYCFGTYFIDLEKKEISRVAEQEVSGEKEYEGFSCWSKKRNILIRYRWHEDIKRRESLKIYFNEIQVDDRYLCKVLRIPFFDAEIYFFSEQAENYLEINRDSFRYEKREYITSSICSTHLECLQCLLGEQMSKEKESVWRESAGGENYLLHRQAVRDYCNFLICNQKMSILNTDVNWFVQYGNLITPIREEALGDYRTLYANEETNIWLTDTRFSYIGNVHLSVDIEGVRYIVEDAFFSYMDMAIVELACMRGINNEYMIIYKTKRRSGQPINMDNQSFVYYICMRYGEIMREKRKQVRMLLPGISKYRTLCVGRLMDNLGTTFEKKWDSTIILPVTIAELNAIVEEMDEHKLMEKIDDIFLREKNPSYAKILEYIRNYGISRHVDGDMVEKAYRELLLEVREVIINKK